MNKHYILPVLIRTGLDNYPIIRPGAWAVTEGLKEKISSEYERLLSHPEFILKIMSIRVEDGDGDFIPFFIAYDEESIPESVSDKQFGVYFQRLQSHVTLESAIDQVERSRNEPIEPIDGADWMKLKEMGVPTFDNFIHNNHFSDSVNVIAKAFVIDTKYYQTVHEIDIPRPVIDKR